MKHIIKIFNGYYGHTGKIWIERAKCEVCGKHKLCISSDASEGEYRNAYICKDCIISEMNKITNQKDFLIIGE